MKRHSETRVLPHSPQQMFDLVADVERYPEFLPWTAAARIRSREQTDEGEVLLAQLVISFKLFRESFLSRVTLYPDDMRIDTEYVEGPFRKMESRWDFAPAEGGCEVRFATEFEFANRLLQGAAGVFFHQAMQQIVKAFERRAQELYG